MQEKYCVLCMLYKEKEPQDLSPRVQESIVIDEFRARERFNDNWTL